MLLKKNIIYSLIITSFALGGYYFVKSRLYDVVGVANAVGGYPYQIGLTGVMVIPCMTSGIPPVCVGGTLCLTKDVASCNFYSEVSGAPSGGNGANALFLKTSLMQAGVFSGGQLIAGGMSSVFMDSGVLGGPAGCAGSCF